MVDQDIQMPGSQWLGQVKGYNDNCGNAAQSIQNEEMRLGGKRIIIHRSLGMYPDLIILNGLKCLMYA